MFRFENILGAGAAAGAVIAGVLDVEAPPPNKPPPGVPVDAALEEKRFDAGLDAPPKRPPLPVAGFGRPLNIELPEAAVLD